jgi:hypothetical protein
LNVTLRSASGLAEAELLYLCTEELMMVRDYTAGRWQKYQCCLTQVIRGKNESHARGKVTIGQFLMLFAKVDDGAVDKQIRIKWF